MKSARSLLLLSSCLAFLNAGLDVSAAAADAKPPGPFARSNLHVWAFEENDGLNRTPLEHARLLKELGITKAGYICRNPERVAVFEEYVKAYQQEGIELIACWTSVPREKPFEAVHIKTFLEVAERHQLKKLQWWVTLAGNFDDYPESERVGKAVEMALPLLDRIAKLDGMLVLYVHGQPWYRQAENQALIADALKKVRPANRVGIVYNFHNAADQAHRFKEAFPKIMPHLVAVNLNGIGLPAPGDGAAKKGGKGAAKGEKGTGKKGTPAIAGQKGTTKKNIGEGVRETDMIQVIHASGWRGPIGIMSNDESVDAKINLQQNLEGLRKIMLQLGDPATAATLTPLR